MNFDLNDLEKATEATQALHGLISENHGKAAATLKALAATSEGEEIKAAAEKAAEAHLTAAKDHAEAAGGIEGAAAKALASAEVADVATKELKKLF
jgi:hypothetical protein